MKPKRRFFFFAFIPLVLLALSGAVMWLWNVILAEVLQVKVISFWQAMGLLVLCRILFGGFNFRAMGRGSFGSERWQSRREKWEAMTDEQRQELRKRWRERCEKR